MFPRGVISYRRRYPVMFHYVIIAAVMFLLAGCAASQAPTVSLNDEQPEIELPGVRSCPNTPVVHERLREAMARLDLKTKVSVIDQMSLNDSDHRRAYAVPTVLLGGRDLYGNGPTPTDGARSRIYEGPGSVPSVDALAHRLSSTINGEEPQ